MKRPKPVKGHWVVLALLGLGLVAISILWFGSIWVTERPNYQPAVGQRP